MGLLDRQTWPAAVPTAMSAGIRPRPPRRIISEFENDIRQLYVRMIDEPIPPRMLEILRAGLAGHKP